MNSSEKVTKVFRIAKKLEYTITHKEEFGERYEQELLALVESLKDLTYTSFIDDGRKLL